MVRKIEGARAQWLSILLAVTVVRMYCCTQKMLKETETEATIGFFVTFLSLVAFPLGGPGLRPPPPPPGYAYASSNKPSAVGGSAHSSVTIISTMP